MINQTGLSDLIQKYQKTLAVNPTSRVFAPLAECYRRAGMLNEALDVLKKGIKDNPDYLLGYLGLAQCYYDMKQYQAGYTLLRPYTESNKDNLKLQRVFASLCLKLDFHEEALDAYKYILFMNPADGEAADYIAEFEDKVIEKKVAQKKQKDSFPISKLHSEKVKPTLDEIDEWVAVDLSSYIEKPVAQIETSSTDNSFLQTEEEAGEDDWQMEKQSLEVQEEEEIPEEESEAELTERRFVVLNNDEEQSKSTQPLITHTLVDLYCAQGHFEKAYDLLEKILELNPDDEKTRVKLDEIREFLPEPEEETQENEDLFVAQENEEMVDEPENEQAAHERLMSLVESKVQGKNSVSQTQDLEEKLWLFHDKVKQKAKEKSLLSSD